MFLAAYSIEDPSWDANSVPTGIRGTYGDKALAKGLSERQLTLHDNITAFGENLGWKGNVTEVRLGRDSRFRDFARAINEASAQERVTVVDYLATRFAESRRIMAPLPPLSAEVLSFARAKALFFRLLGIPSEGHVQQFLIAALLAVHRRRYRVEVRTHHPHAADKFDGAAGDVEEWSEGRLLGAYEVTVRPDWKNRLQDLRRKMHDAGLSKYVVVASAVNTDEDLADPARLIAFLEPAEADIAVVDIKDFATVFAAELSARELREAVNLAYEFIATPTLCGKADVRIAFGDVVADWLDAATP